MNVQEYNSGAYAQNDNHGPFGVWRYDAPDDNDNCMDDNHTDNKYFAE